LHTVFFSFANINQNDIFKTVEENEYFYIKKYNKPNPDSLC